MLLRFTAVLCLLAAAVPALAQEMPNPSQTDESASARNNNIGPVGIIPAEKGFNASLTTSSQHDSEAGWSSNLLPNVAYRFNKYFSADASANLFLYILTTQTGGTAAHPTTTRKVSHAVGDTTLAAHLSLPITDMLGYTLTSTLSLPSGSKTLGLGAGQTTYDFNNHFEADFPLSPFVEIGIGDSSSLVNQRVRRGQSSIGTVSHFEVGGSIDLPRDISFSASAYEILPIGNQNVYSTRTVRKKTVTTLTGTGIAEDNGFNTSLDIPLQQHVTLSGFYNRSLRQHNDTAGFSFTFLLRGRQQQPLR